MRTFIPYWMFCRSTLAVEIQCLIRSQVSTSLADFTPNLPLQTPTLPDASLYELVTILRPDSGMDRLYLLPVFVRGMDALLSVGNELLRELFGHGRLTTEALKGWTRAGITTVRDLQGPRDTILARRAGIAAGKDTTLPRLLAAGLMHVRRSTL